VIRDYLAQAAQNFPDKLAFIEGDRSITWKRLDERASKFARALQMLGMGKGDVIGILCHEHLEVYEYWFGCLKIGALRASINWRFAPQEMLHVARDSAAKVLLLEANCVPLMRPYFDELQANGVILIGFGGDHGLPNDYETLLAAATEPPVLPELRDEDLACLSYTSGSTGAPKGVMITQKGLRECVVWTVVNVGFRPDDVWYLPASSAWVTLFLGSFGVTNGMTTVIPEGDFNVADFMRHVERFKVTLLLLVPTMLQRVMDEYEKHPADFSSVRTLAYGSSPCPPSVLRRAMKLFPCRFLNFYGLTESTGGWISFLHHTDIAKALNGIHPERINSVGLTSVHFNTTIRDQEGNILPPGEWGEIWVKSETLMRGYVNLPKETEEVMRGEWLRTNDIGYKDEEGYLFLTDRQKFMIITGAANVFPTTVENVMADHPSVAEVAVVGVPHPEWQEAVVAAVRFWEGMTATQHELVDFCRDRLAVFELPKHVEVVSELPRGVTGKLDKKALKAWFRENADRLPWRLPED
jgi:acyl-CoA synthetase (AMP-forming)/AMP-acid ligase II